MATGTTKITASASAVTDITTPLTEIEDWMGTTAIPTADLDDTPWVASAHIIRPEFYGSPSPRSIGQSGDVFWAYRGNGVLDSMIITEDTSRDEWLPVPGLSKTVHIEPHAASSHVLVTITAVFYSYEFDGTSTSSAASYALFNGTSKIVGTTRTIDGAGSSNSRAQRYVHVTEGLVNVGRGLRNFWVGMNIVNSASARTFQLYKVRAASFVVETEVL